MDSRGDSPPQSRPWSDLMPELIELISQFETLSSDIRSFRQVCSNWRKHSIPSKSNILSRFLPCPVPPCDDYPLSLFSRGCDHLTIVSSSVFLVTRILPKTGASSSKSSPNDTWMVIAEETRPGVILLRHPITGKPIKHSESTFNYGHEFNVKMLSEGYNLRNTKSEVSKVLVNCKGTFAVILRKDGHLHGIKLRRQPPEISTWLHVMLPNHRRKITFVDMVHFKGMVIVADNRRKLYKVTYEVDTLVVERILPKHRQHSKDRRGCFCSLETSQFRLVVERLSFGESRFHVVAWQDYDNPTSSSLVENYMFDDVTKCWSGKGCLSYDLVVFAGVSHTFVAPAEHFTGCPRNCIVFTYEFFNRRCFRSTGVVEIRRFSDDTKNELHLPVLSRILWAMWPPPPWFRSKKLSNYINW